MNHLPHWTAHQTLGVLAPMAMTQDVTRTDAVRYKTLLFLALDEVLPQKLYILAVGGDGTLIALVGTLGCMAEKEEALLFVANGGGMVVAGQMRLPFNLRNDDCFLWAILLEV